MLLGRLPQRPPAHKHQMAFSYMITNALSRSMLLKCEDTFST